MSNTKNKPKADELFCKRCKATSGVFFRGLCGNCWVERTEMAEKALDRACEFLKVAIFACPPEDNWGIEGKGCDWGDCDKCWKKYFLEGDSDDDNANVRRISPEL